MAEIHSALANHPVVITQAPDEPRLRIIAPREFLGRLTMPQKVAIRPAAQANAVLAVWIDELVASVEVDLDHPDTVAGLGAMQAAGLLTAQDVQRIRGLP